MRPFSISLRGRLNNFNLPKNQPLLPLFEAIVNAVHAIEERKREGANIKGRIEIQIIRDDQIMLSDFGELPPIHSFYVSDNGVGFNEPNLESFMMSDSTYKAEYGGKGVGRFSWLIAFDKAEIESCYTDNGQYVKRSFEFSPTQKSIDDSLVDIEPQTDHRTTVKLLHCTMPYRDNLPKKGMTVALHIIQHCLVYFMSDDCPQIDLIDTDERYNLNNIFREKIKTSTNHTVLTVGAETFDLLHVKAEESTINGNKLYLCAHNRLVETKELEKYITDLDRSIYRESGFWYVGVLSGKYLDDAVDMNRLSFNIPDGGPLESMANMVTMDQIMRAVVGEVETFLGDYLHPIAETKLKRITDYVTFKAPQFRHLLKHMPEAISRIKPNLSDDKLDDELHRIKRDFDKRTSAESKKLLEDLDSGRLSTTEYAERFSKQVARITSANSAALAEYVAHRKVVLELMDYAIRRNNDGKFQKESFLHDLIYPMRSTSDEVEYNAHNLWLIDEKLAYCSYISSDIPFDNNPKEIRTDIMVLDRPVAVSDEENSGTEYGTIVLFELKRPMRNDYSEGDNPINQLYGYVRKLQSGKAKDKDGRIIRVGSHTKFYLYAVCDVTSTLEGILENYDFTQTPDKLGFFRYNEKFNAYIEILSYDKIIQDAKKRNRILFEKLGI